MDLTVQTLAKAILSHHLILDCGGGAFLPARLSWCPLLPFLSAGSNTVICGRGVETLGGERLGPFFFRVRSWPFTRIGNSSTKPSPPTLALLQQPAILASLTCHHATSPGRPSHPPFRPFFFWSGQACLDLLQRLSSVGKLLFLFVGAAVVGCRACSDSRESRAMSSVARMLGRKKHCRSAAFMTNCLSPTCTLLRDGRRHNNITNSSVQPG